ncbi:MAG: hypothetical protein SGBAC_004011 [Bacillariaceae sp.]
MTSGVNLKRLRSKRMRNSHPSLAWYSLIAIAAMGSHSQHHGVPSANALSPSSPKTKHGFNNQKPHSILERLRGGGENKDNQSDNVLEMDDTELDAYIEFLLQDREKNPFQRQEEVSEQLENLMVDSAIDVRETNQQGKSDETGSIHFENVQGENDAPVTETVETATVEDDATSVVSIEVGSIHSENLRDEIDSPATEFVEAATTMEEDTASVAFPEVETSHSENVPENIDLSTADIKEEIEDILESTIIEQDEEVASSEMAEDEIVSTAQSENDDLYQTPEESVDAPDGETVETETLLKEEIVVTTGRSSLWGRLYKPLVTFEHDESSNVRGDENVIKDESKKEETTAEAMVQEVSAVNENSEEKIESGPSLREQGNQQWQKLKSIMKTQPSISEEKEVDNFVGREQKRDYSKIYNKYYAVESKTDTDDSSETENSRKPGWLALFSKNFETEDAEVAVKEADDSQSDLNPSITSSVSSYLLDEDSEETSLDTETITLESDEMICSEDESIGTKREVLSLDRLEEGSEDDWDDMSSSDMSEELQEDQLPVLSLEKPTESATENKEDTSDKEDSSEQVQDSVVLSLDIPLMERLEDVDAAPILQAEKKSEGVQDSTVLSLNIPDMEIIEDNNDDSQFQDEVEGRDSRVALSLEIPSVEEPEEDDEVIFHDYPDTTVLSLNIPVVDNSEEVEPDLLVEAADDATSSIVGRFVLSLDKPSYTIEIASDQSDDKTLELEDDTEDVLISTDLDTTAEQDVDALNDANDPGACEEDSSTESVEDDESLDDVLQLDVESLQNDIDLEALDEDLPTESGEDECLDDNLKVDDDSLQDDIDLDDMDYEELDDLLHDISVAEKLGIVDQSLMILFVLLVLLEEMLKTYILPPIEELLDWALYQKPPPLFREDFSIRKFLGVRGGAAKATSVGGAKGDDIEDGPKEEESNEGTDPEKELRSTKTKTNEATPRPTLQNTPAIKVRPNLIYRFLLGYGRAGHSIIMASIFSIEWIETYLPALTFLVASVKNQVLGERKDFREVEESFSSQTTGFVDGTGSTIRGGKKKKAQTQKDDEHALDQLNRLGDASQARYYFVSNTFLKRHAIGPYSSSTSEMAVAAKAPRVDQDEEESDEDWVVEALTRKEASTAKLETEPSVDVSISSSSNSVSVGVDLSFGEKSRKPTKRPSISKLALSSASARKAKSRKPAGQRVSDRESGVVGRIRAVGVNSLVGRSILGAYPGDVPPPDEAADANGLLGLASKYGYGDWSDVDWSDADDTEFVPRKKPRRKRKSVPGPMRKEKEPLASLGFEEIVQSSRTRRTRSASSRPRTNNRTESTATQPLRKTRVRRKKLPSNSTLKKANSQKDAVAATRSKVLKAKSGSTVTGPAIESMKESMQSESDAFIASESSTTPAESRSSTGTVSSNALKKSTTQIDIVNSTRERNLLKPGKPSTTESAVAGAAIEALKENAKSIAHASSSSNGRRVTRRASGSLKKTENPKRLGTAAASSAVAGPAIGSIRESAAKTKSGVANSAIDALKAKSKEKSKSSILDPKVQKGQKDEAGGNQDRT